MPRPSPRFLILSLLIAAAALLAIVAITQPEDEEREAPKSSGALAKAPKINECVRPGNTRGEDDEGLDVETLSTRVEDLRDLSFDESPEVDLVSQDEMDERLAGLFEDQYTESIAEIDARMMTALGVIPPGTDLRELRAASLEGGVAGVYDPEAKKLYVLSGDDPGLLERITLVHELEHAIVDQTFGIPTEDVDLARADTQLAEASLIEGDATLLMEIYAVRHTSIGDLLGAAGSIPSLDEGALPELPHYLQRELLFPYLEGAEFACHLYLNGGWSSVDAAYGRGPTTSMEILFPERLGTPPVDVAPGQAPGSGWELLGRGSFGAAPLKWLLEAPGDEPERKLPLARSAAAAWAGDGFQVWADGERTAVALTFAARGGGDRTLCVALTGWYASAFPDAERSEGGSTFTFDGEQQDGSVRCGDGEVRVGIGPDPETAERVSRPGAA